MNNEIHIEAMKEENASIVQANRELSAYCVKLVEHMRLGFKPSENDDDQGEYELKTFEILKLIPKVSLAENNAQVIEKLIYACPNPNLLQTKIKEALQVYADALRAGK